MTTAIAECPVQTAPEAPQAPQAPQATESPQVLTPPVPAPRCIVARAALLRALTLCAAVAPARSPKPILLCAKLTAAQGRLTVSTTDLETGIRLAIPDTQAAVERDGEVAVPVKDFLKIVRNSNDAVLTLDEQDGYLYVRGADARFKLPTEPVDQFPPLPRPTGAPDFEVGTDILGRMIGQTLFACALTNSRYAQNSVLIHRAGDALSLVATDGHRLAIATSMLPAGKGERSAAVPGKTVAVLAKVTGKPTSRPRPRPHPRNSAPTPVQAYVGEHEALFVVGEVTLTALLVEGDFPPYKQIVPPLGEIQATLATEDLIAGLERAKVWASPETHDGVKLSFSAGQLTISPIDKSLDGAALHVPVAAYQGEPLDIGFNPRFLVEALRVVGAGQVTLDMRAAHKPAALRTGEYVYAVMPVPV